MPWKYFRALLSGHLPSLLVLLLGVMLSVNAFRNAAQSEVLETRRAFERAAATHATAIQQEMARYEQMLDGLAALYDASAGAVSRAQFHVFAQRLLINAPGVQALEWIPRVPAEHRAAYEATARLSYPEFRITQHLGQGRMIPAEARDEYFPVYYVEPQAGNETALGFDLGSDPVRREALLRSAASGTTVATAPITLVQEKADQRGFLLFRAVYRGGGRRGPTQALAGFVLGVFRVGDVVEQALQSQPAMGLDLLLRDSAAPPNEREFYTHRSRTRGTEPMLRTETPHDTLRVLRDLEVGDRRWSIVIVPAPGYYDLAISSRNWLRLLTGLALTIALAAIVWISRRHELALVRLNQQLLESQQGFATRAAELAESQASLRHERLLFHALLDNIPDIIYFKDTELRYLRINKALTQWYRLKSSDEAAGRMGRDFMSSQEVALKGERDEKEILRTGVGIRDVIDRHRLPNGSELWFSKTEVPIRDAQGQIIGLVAISRDVTKRMLAEQRVERLNRVYAVLSGINGLIVRVRDRGELYRKACQIAIEAGGFASATLTRFDPAASAMALVASSRRDAAFLEAFQAMLVDPSPEMVDFATPLIKQRKPVVLNELTVKLPSPIGRLVQIDGARSLIVLPLLVANDVIGTLGLHAAEADFFDADEVKLLIELAGDIAFAIDHLDKAEKLDYLANYDQITGLANRNLLHDRLAQAISHAPRSRRRNIAVMYLDLDQFKFINDSLGHTTGDQLLTLVATRLKSCVRDSDTVARLSADEFVIVLSDLSDVRHVTKAAERIRESVANYPHIAKVLGDIMSTVSRPAQIADREISITCSIGISIYPQDGDHPAALVKHAEAAMFRAKELGRNNFQFYTADLNARMAERVSLQGMLKLAIERREFALHYQPKLDLKTGRVASVEALLRWQHPERGWIPPSHFVPLLEETGMILDVGRWVIMQAVADYRAWRGAGLEPPRIAVNVSQLQLAQGDFVAQVGEAIGSGETGFLDVEITESLIMKDLETSLPKLGALREMGIGIAIDDFGTGYSSLSQLARLPATALKIDRAFVVNMLTNSEDRTIVAMMISLAHSLRLTVIAEGVETEEQLTLLSSMGCDEIQGYVVSAALPPDAFWEWKAGKACGSVSGKPPETFPSPA